MSTYILTLAVGWISLSLLCGIAWVALLLLIDLVRTLKSGASAQPPDDEPGATSKRENLDHSIPPAPLADRHLPAVEPSLQKPVERNAAYGEDIAA